ncbi:MAG TPA: four helix bundle protein [Kofleriaceae bacterium]|nr:four helix bundle protein [Kofleriaceae bacterium]
MVVLRLACACARTRRARGRCAGRERLLLSARHCPGARPRWAKGQTIMALDAYTVSISLLRALAPLLKRLAAVDPKLEDQTRRAAMSVSLNIAEAGERKGKDQRNRFRISLASAAEVAAALDVAAALGYIADGDASDALELIDRVRAMTYRLAR